MYDWEFSLPFFFGWFGFGGACHGVFDKKKIVFVGSEMH